MASAVEAPSASAHGTGVRPGLTAAAAAESADVRPEQLPLT